MTEKSGALTSVAALAAFLGVAFLVSGCASAPGVRAVDFEAALARAKSDPAWSDPLNRRHVLVALDVLSLASQTPDPWSATQASNRIETAASGNPGQLSGAVSLATWERARVYLGDTHERAYASLLGGVAYWMIGETDNAAALWRNALDIDGESAEGHREDFCAAQYLLAKYYWNQSGQRDTAEIHLRHATSRWRGNPYLRPERIASDNLVVLVEVGGPPQKETTGPQGSMLQWVPTPFPGDR